MKKKKGFTLLEILLVVGIIAILAGIVIIAINPGKQLATVRNTQRLSDLKQVYNAMTQFYIDKGFYPASTTLSTTTLLEVCNTGSVSNTSTSTTGVNCATAGLTNLSELVPVYLTAIPVDPSGASSTLSFIPTAYANTNGTGYKVGRTLTNQLNLYAPLAELSSKVAIGNWIPISGLVAHYLMNDTDGITTIDSKGGYTGTGTYTSNPLGKINTALSFNGSSNYVDVGLHNMGVTNMSLSVWVKTSSSNNMIVFGGADEGVAQFSVNLLGGGKAEFYSYNSGVRIVGATTIKDGSWHHLVYGYNKDTQVMKIYVDGVEDASGNGGIMDFSTWYWRIGVSGATHSNKFTGSIDDIRVYNKVLSPNEISQIYNSGSGTEME